MKVTLFMAISINGYVTGQSDDTEWVKDTDALYQIIADKGACVMGRRTYDECVKYNAFPYKNALNIVLTHDPRLLSQSSGQTMFVSNSPAEILKLISQQGHKELLIVGGGQINSQFLSAGLIDEIILDVHPIIIDGGIKLFEDSFPRLNLEYVDSKPLTNGLVQIHYRVNNI